MASTDNQQTKTKRDLIRERLSKKYPEKDFNDDDVFLGQINDDYDDYDKRLSDYKDREGKMAEMFSTNPKAAHFMVAWHKGEDPVLSLIRQFGTDIKDAIDDPERQEQIAEANKEFVDRVSKEKSLDEEYTKNLATSLEFLSQFQQKNNLSDEDIDNIMELLMNVIKDGIMGKFSPESIEMARKALNHDVDVADAGRVGEVKGRNAKIETKLRKENTGDGISHLDGKSGPIAQVRKPRSIFDEAREAR